MSKTENKIKPEITNKTEYWDINLSKITDANLIDEVIKFHQGTTIIKRDNNSNPYNIDIIKWLSNTEHTDVLPNLYISEHPLIPFDCNNQGSIREFNINEELNFTTLSRIIKNTFGRTNEKKSKRHPSAGGLYPVIPVICILNTFTEAILTRGAYVYDSYSHSLKKIKEWTDNEYYEFVNVLNPWEKGALFSNYLIAYAIDIKRAVAKYKKRGYRQALIELGTMDQAFKESLIEENQNLGEFSYSAFDDNALTYHLGLNPRTCPVALIQWFGKRGVKS
ncbi:hypothetical protein [Robertmurraya andreesenii]|uniref:SagB-type dehydrogenase family enzyme n=1 Tax=Anoxybacillus andreesenii TaxID=1325932 RepID=A0ABT9V6C0_9BACL|nr:hypothetical protein [Robertmurraya andreesenii]MDQ0156484.1 SagB-type dehydrogenase family enzyme [Robertmurraya andreesenii]